MEVIAHKYRLYPNKSQADFLDECFDAARFAWNRIHETVSLMYEWDGKQPSKSQVGRMLTELSNDSDFSFLKTPPKNAIEYVNRYYFEAWQRYWSLRKKGEIQALQAKYIEKRQASGRPIKYNVLNCIGQPKFKSRRDKQSFHIGCRTPKLTYLPNPKFRGGELDYENQKLIIKKVSIKIKMHRPIPDGAKVKAVTVSKTKAGKYYASFTIELDISYPDLVDAETSKTVSVDAGVKGFYCSDGVFYMHPRPLLKLLKRLKFLQRQLSRKKKGSSNYEKHLVKVNKLHEHIANVRKDYLHNVSAELTRRDDIHTIAVEKLTIKAMAEKRLALQSDNGFQKNGRSQQKRDNLALMDSALYMFRQMLQYKGRANGKNIVIVDQFEPTNKECSSCGHVNNHVHFRMKTWQCGNCGEKHGKWENSATVILKKSLP